MKDFLEEVKKRYIDEETIESIFREESNKSFVLSAHEGRLDVFKKLNEGQSSLIDIKKFKSLAFYSAVRNEHIGIIDYMIEKKMFNSEYLSQSINMISQTRNNQFMEYLLDHPALSCAKVYMYSNALLFSVKAENWSLVSCIFSLFKKR
jgi:hypothetical protein